MMAWKLILLGVTADLLIAQTPPDQSRVQELEGKLEQALRDLGQLRSTVESLQSDLAAIKQPAEAPPAVKSDLIIGPDIGGDERGGKVGAMPEIFIQTRYSALPVAGSGEFFHPNFRLSRIETRWAGKINERLGFGLEFQYHPAPEGSPEEIVNEAFIEYYPTKHVTLRAGQFIKPFGFDIQQSSSVRESPERAIFAGYFFPGQRDRGVMVSGDLGSLQYFAGVFNGNRFFNDNNRQVNYVARVRKIFEKPKLAVGVSVQAGKQILPPGVSGNNNERVVGVDAQYAVGRVGVRVEAVAGNMPSTRLGLQPEFFSAFRPGLHSSAGSLLLNYQVSEKQNVYARYNSFRHDPVTGRDVHAVNFGLTRFVGEHSRLSVDYQYKNRASFEDDAINGRLQISWGLLIGKPSEKNEGK